MIKPFRLDHVSTSRRYILCCNSYKLKTHLASSLLLMKSRAMKVPTTATTNTALSTVDGDRDILLLQLCRTPKPSLAISQSDSVTLPRMRADQREITSSQSFFAHSHYRVTHQVG